MIWLMTDERIADLDAAIAALPRASGIIFRHYALDRKARRTLFDHVARKARAGRHLLLLADTPERARQWGADGAHDLSARRSRGLRTCAVHSVGERIAAHRARFDLIFVSPVYSTRSHPGAKGIGLLGARRIAGNEWCLTILLGGMDAKKFRKMRSRPPHGWAGIDAFRI
jgi:thiamine-phosphate pyrophosphorylase